MALFYFPPEPPRGAAASWAPQENRGWVGESPTLPLTAGRSQIPFEMSPIPLTGGQFTEFSEASRPRVSRMWRPHGGWSEAPSRRVWAAPPVRTRAPRSASRVCIQLHCKAIGLQSALHFYASVMFGARQPFLHRSKVTVREELTVSPRCGDRRSVRPPSRPGPNSAEGRASPAVHTEKPAAPRPAS